VKKLKEGNTGADDFLNWCHFFAKTSFPQEEWFGFMKDGAPAYKLNRIYFLLNRAPRHEGVLENGGIAPLIL
jgi:hypothetical protein